MLAIIRNSTKAIRLMSGRQEFEPLEVETGLLDGGYKRYDEIFNSQQRKSDKDVLASVMAQL